MTIIKIHPRNQGNGLGNGFFSNYRVCLEQLMHYHLRANVGIPYISWANTLWVDGFNPMEVRPFMSEVNPFDYWFDQEIPTREDVLITCTDKVGALIDHAEDYFNKPISLEYQQFIDQLYIKPHQYLLDSVEGIYNEQLKEHTVLGVMARGSEYNALHPQYGVFGIDDYIREISKILEQNSDIDKLFLVSEETEYVEKMHKAFPSSYFMPDVFRRTDETDEYINTIWFWPMVSTKRKDQCRLLGQEMIIQTKLLGKCDYLFGRHCGTLAGAVLWNENIKKVFKI